MYQAILVPTDGSEQATQAADHALEIARQFGSTLYVLHVVDDRYAKRTAETMDALSRARNSPELRAIEEYRMSGGDALTREITARAHDAGLDAEQGVLSGDPADAIAEFAENQRIDLIVLGARGRSAVGKYLMGDVAGKVARHATTPVMLVRADD